MVNNVLLMLGRFRGIECALIKLVWCNYTPRHGQMEEVRFALPLKNPPNGGLFNGGKGEIRTHGGLHLGGFQDRCHKPLDHSSA